MDSVVGWWKYSKRAIQNLMLRVEHRRHPLTTPPDPLNRLRRRCVSSGLRDQSRHRFCHRRRKYSELHWAVSMRPNSNSKEWAYKLIIVPIPQWEKTGWRGIGWVDRTPGLRVRCWSDMARSMMGVMRRACIRWSIMQRVWRGRVTWRGAWAGNVMWLARVRRLIMQGAQWTCSGQDWGQLTWARGAWQSGVGGGQWRGMACNCVLVFSPLTLGPCGRSWGGGRQR